MNSPAGNGSDGEKSLPPSPPASPEQPEQPCCVSENRIDEGRIGEGLFGERATRVDDIQHLGDHVAVNAHVAVEVNVLHRVVQQEGRRWRLLARTPIGRRGGGRGARRWRLLGRSPVDRRGTGRGAQRRRLLARAPESCGGCDTHGSRRNRCGLG